jgi:hypothetical protein
MPSVYDQQNVNGVDHTTSELTLRRQTSSSLQLHPCSLSLQPREQECFLNKRQPTSRTEQGEYVRVCLSL